MGDIKRPRRPADDHHVHSEDRDQAGPDPASSMWQHPSGPRPRRRRSSYRTVETVLLATTACLLAATAWPIAQRGWSDEGPAADAPCLERRGTGRSRQPSVAAVAPVTDTPRIQIALLLDTSSSMDGLIDQARRQLWGVVNALDSASFEDARPQLEIAIYEYGNAATLQANGWSRRVTPFSSELDVVSEGLFGLSTHGGEEFAGQTIGRAIDELKWAEGSNVLRVLYIAGNEEFDQGPVDYRSAIARARAKGIVVNTINCVGLGGADPGWSEAAAVGGGKALQIDQDAPAVQRNAPQDADILSLGQELNRTYIRYGSQGSRGLRNLETQDNNTIANGVQSTVERTLSKSTGYYRNPSWDLVDAIEDGVAAYEGLNVADLPEELQGLDPDAIEEFVEDKATQRQNIQTKLAKLRADREEFLTAQGELSGDATLRRALLLSLREQATAAGFTLDQR